MRKASTKRFVWSGVVAWVVVASAVAQNPDDGYFDWAMGREDPTGTVVAGHDLHVQQNYGNITHPVHGPRPHAGVDLQWFVRGDEQWGFSTFGAPVYAAANGRVVCDNFLEDRGHYGDYPGRVVVLEHRLPTGERVYSQYGHVQYPSQDPHAVAVGATVRRGQRIGSVHDQGGNSHLHFEIRHFERDPETDQCAGPGYGRKAPPATDKKGDPIPHADREREALRLLEQEGWTDPVEFHYHHRPPFPAPVVLWSHERRNIREAPQEHAGIVGELPRSSQVLADKVHREGNSANWWYRIQLERGWGWINAFLKGGYQSELAVGEPWRTAPGWREPGGRPFIHYQFDDAGAFDRGAVPNAGSGGARYDGVVRGAAALAPGPEAVILPPPAGGNNYALDLDGETAHVEVPNSGALNFQTRVVVSALVRRETNQGEDAILSKWYGEDQWLLTLYPDGHGLLIFTVRLVDGAYASLEYPIPDDGYLGKWVHVGARFEVIRDPRIPSEGHGLLRLYWQGRLVGERTVDAERLHLRASTSPIHVGDAGVGTPWSRFHGRIDEVRIWR